MAATALTLPSTCGSLPVKSTVTRWRGRYSAREDPVNRASSAGRRDSILPFAWPPGCMNRYLYGNLHWPIPDAIPIEKILSPKLPVCTRAARTRMHQLLRIVQQVASRAPGALDTIARANTSFNRLSPCMAKPRSVRPGRLRAPQASARC